ncbi:MAG TPA: carboxypeptidase-like regulatory domain-containing protein [Candidatus Baltobacteraceae bacterium]|nr:carboxypeptidase-like regulatory domain-containing protein [Candidatus Baltobacteraceae bacterium]
MKRCLLFLLLPAVLAAAPAPLVVGSVRDQYGAPIAGARVSAGDNVTTTDALGTFALSAAHVQSVAITCAYCERLTVAVVEGEPVIALVRRYDALAQEAPTDRDVESVPYGRAESIASLRPFTVLENSSRPLPGPQLSDRASSSRGALVLDDGIPAYDVTSNQSAFVAFPDYALQHVSWLPPSDAFAYGDLAGGGTLLAQTHSADRWTGVLAAGSTGALRAGVTTDDTAWSAAASRDPDDQRVRGDGFVRIPLGDDAFSVTAVASQDRYAPGSQHLDTSQSGVRLSYEAMRETRVNFSLVADGGGYDGADRRLAYSAKWSDVQAQAGVATNARIQFFTDAGARTSSGSYAAGAPISRTSGIITQARIDMGARTAGDRYSARIGVGAFDFAYSGGAAGAHTSLTGGMLAPGFAGTYAFDPHWSLQLHAGESFALPTILEAFVYPQDTPELEIDRNALLIETLNYGDLRRFRAAATVMSERVTGLDRGTIHSAGVSAEWQIAPTLSLRAWLLRENDFTRPYEPVYRFGAQARPATVGSYWLTYESAGLRIDAIYRRDLLDYAVDPHFDASISAPVGGGLRIFAATQRRAGTRGLAIGLRMDAP